LAVTIGDLPIDMVLDTGATISTVSASLADRLIAEGQASEQPAIALRLANGSTVTQRTVIINSLTVGRHKQYLVPLTVSPDGADMLLGLPVLDAIGAFKIDVAHGQVIFSAAVSGNR
jgi:predicted aspartyl protease